MHQERIGASNYFWSFPGEAAAKVAGEIAKLEKRLQVGACHSVLAQRYFCAVSAGPDLPHHKLPRWQTMLPQWRSGCRGVRGTCFCTGCHHLLVPVLPHDRPCWPGR